MSKHFTEHLENQLRNEKRSDKKLPSLRHCDVGKAICLHYVSRLKDTDRNGWNCWIRFWID